jgi:competence protein ComEC
MCREPLLIPLLGFAGGILLAEYVAFRPVELAAAGGAFVVLAVLSHRRGSWATTVSIVALAMAAAGGLCREFHRTGPAPQLDADDGETLILSGCVVEPPVLSADREQVVLELEPGARAAVSLAVKDGEEAPGLVYGQRIELDAKVRRPRNFENPGAFDYVRYLARQQVYWTASARASSPIRIRDGRCGNRLAGAIYRLRTAALDRIESLYAGDDYAIAMLEAILIGESGKLEKVWTDHFRRTGTFHALVISGMHIVVLAGTVMTLLRLFLLPEMAALAIAAVGAWVYAAVSGWSAPVVRAAGGFSLYLVGRYMFRRGRVLNLLSAIALVYLAWDPSQLFDASFQLSFLCVAAIGAFAAPLMEWALSRYRPAARSLADAARDRKCAAEAAEFRLELRLLAETAFLWTRIPARFFIRAIEIAMRVGVWAAEMVMLSAVVQIALALPMALYFHRISITGLTANLGVVPLMNLLVPVGFAAIFTGLRPLVWLARMLLVWAEWVAGWHVRFEPAYRVPDPPLWLAIALVAALAGVAVAVRLKTRWIYPALVATAGLFTLVMTSPFPAEVARGSLELTTIDVGQGDGLMLTTPDGQVILIDAGGFPSFGRKKKSNLDIGEDVVSPYLWTRRLKRVDVIAVTHAHEDHIGGLEALIHNFRPREIWTGAVPADSNEAAILRRAAASGIPVFAKVAGEAFESGGARFEVLSPPRDYEPNPKAPNNDSLAMRVRYGRHSFLLTGDMERQMERGLVDSGALGDTTVLKVAHHGSKTSSTPQFLDAARPQFAIISVGAGNLFRHPNADVLERLSEHHAEVLRTDRDGLITVRSDGRRLTVSRMVDERRLRPLTEPLQMW